MLAKVSANLMPPPSLTEQIAITKVHSLHSLCTNIISERPYRAPHHSINLTALLGGGPNLIPGEISLAHLGVLHLDELPEFRRDCLEALRQPLENHFVKLDRINGHTQYPADFMLVATMNPCPCGYLGDPSHECKCTEIQIQNYQKKLSGPLFDRIDMCISVNKVKNQILSQNIPNSDREHTVVKNTITEAIKRQNARYNKDGVFNSSLSSFEVSQKIHLDKKAENLLASASEKLNLSARSYFKTIKVARTIADLDKSEEIKESHLAEALTYRKR